MGTLSYKYTGGYGVSYSRLQTLKTCARKFQIENLVGYRPRESNVTFAYGHMVGAGIQEILEHNDLDLAIFNAALEWDLRIDAIGTNSEVTAKKSFAYAMEAIERFSYLMNGLGTNSIKEDLSDWKVARFTNDAGKDVVGIETSFEVKYVSEDMEGNEKDYVYEGHIDCILYNEKKKQLKVLELKTSGMTKLHPAMYANSQQALGYSIIVDIIAKQLGCGSSYEVTYLIYQSKSQGYTVFPFFKTSKQKADWINSLLLDTHLIETYRAYTDQWPVNASGCFAYFRPCNYFERCHLENDYFEKLLKEDKTTNSFVESEDVDFSLKLDDIIAAQELMVDEDLDQETLIGVHQL